MPRPQREHGNPKTIQDWIAEGRGAGRNGAYRPWYRVQNVRGGGIRRQLESHITGDRNVHVLSGLESNCFWIVEWWPNVVDIREQFPLLPLESTLTIAKELKVEPHTDPQSGLPIVATTDLLVTTLENGQEKHHALTIKPVEELASTRTQQKFQIERAWHQSQAHSWSIVTNRDIPRHLAANLKILRRYRTLNQFHNGVPVSEVERIERVLLPLIWKAELPLSQAAASCDERLGLRDGTSLTVAYHFVYTRHWKVNLEDLLSPLNPGQPLKLAEPQPQDSDEFIRTVSF